MNSHQVISEITNYFAAQGWGAYDAAVNINGNAKTKFVALLISNGTTDIVRISIIVGCTERAAIACVQKIKGQIDCVTQSHEGVSIEGDV